MLITLKELCEKVGVSRRSIQCYEKEGLMKPQDKNKYGHLLYSQESVVRAEQIHFLQQLGLKLKDVKRIIDAPKSVKRQELELRINDLKLERNKLDSIIEEAVSFIEML